MKQALLSLLRRVAAAGEGGPHRYVVMSETQNTSKRAVRPRRNPLWRHVLLLLFASALFGNLYALFSIRENWLAVAEKTIDIQNNINIISDRIYDMDARFSAEQLKLSEVKGELQQTRDTLSMTQSEIDAASDGYAVVRSYLRKLAEAVEYEEPLDGYQPSSAPTEAAAMPAPAEEQRAVLNPEGSMEWIDAAGKKHTVQIRNGRIRELVEEGL